MKSSCDSFANGRGYAPCAPEGVIRGREQMANLMSWPGE